MIMEQWGKDTDRGTRSTRWVKEVCVRATLSTKDILLLTDFLASSEFTLTLPVSLYISNSTNWNEGLNEISNEYGVMAVKFVTSKKIPKAL
jgi:hypothetical protein